MLSFNFHVGDWCKSTVHLTDSERGVYLSLLIRYYDTEKPLPADRETIYRLACARNADAMQDVDAVLIEFFTLDADGWHNKRADKEILAFRDKSEKASRSAGARWTKERTAKAQQTQTEGNADAMPTQCEGNANHIPHTTYHIPENKKPLSASADVVAVFDHWRVRMNHSSAKLDEKRRKLIQKALKLSYTTDDLIAAIDGCAKSTWHMGQNDRQTIYDGLDLILRDASKIDSFIKLNNQPAQAGGHHAANKPALTGAAARNAEVSAAIRQLRTGTAGASTACGSGDFRQAAGSDAGQVLEHVPDEQ